MRSYRRRSIRPLPRWDPPGWRFKVYAVSADGEPVGDALLGASRTRAGTVLREVASRTPHYGVGFMGVHRGAGADVAFVDWWAAENELHHHVFVARPGRPESLRPRTPDELIACVWDLEVLAFEREAWIRCVLAHPAEPRWDEYLATQLEGSP